jgi:hypothetical protein
MLRTTPYLFLAGTLMLASVPAQAEDLATVQVREEGLYVLTYEALAAAGIDLAGAKTRRLALRRRGEPVPIHVTKGVRFGPGDSIVFVAPRPEKMLYRDRDVYVLYDLDKKRGRRVVDDRSRVPGGASRSYYMETVEVEPERFYSTIAPVDPWWADFVFTFGGPVERTVSIGADAYLPGVAPVSAEMEIWGATEVEANPDHHVELSLNGVRVGEAVFDGRVQYTVSGEAGFAALQEGENQLTLKMPADLGVGLEMVVLDAWRITYPRRFLARQGQLAFTADGKRFTVEGLTEASIAVYRAYPDGMVARIRNIETHGDCTSTALPSCTATFAGSGSQARYYLSQAGSLRSPAAIEPVVELEDITDGVAEYLVLAHPDFIDENLELFTQFRRAEYRVKVVDVEQVYAQFGHYERGPHAIKTYLTYAIQNMGTRFVLLVGGDTTDPLNHLGADSAPVSFMPSWYGSTGMQTFLPMDAKYVDVDDDNVPDAAVGRWPVRTSEELAVAVNKTMTYEYPSDYEQTAVFASDGFDAANRYSFRADAETLLATLPPAWQANMSGNDKAYVEDDGLAGAREQLLAALNQGRKLVSFTGHSNEDTWSFSGLLRSSDLSSLTNYGRPSVVTQWGCWNTYYAKPSEDTMAHAFMLAPPANGDVTMAPGAVAVVGAVGNTFAVAERQLAKIVYDYLFQPGMTLGEAVWYAKRDYAKLRPAQLDVILGWSVLSDPALRVAKTP